MNAQGLSLVSALTVPRRVGTVRPNKCQAPFSQRLPGRQSVRVRAEADKEVDVGSEAKPQEAGGNFYNDEKPLKPKDDMSPEYKAKLRNEYLSLGGSPNTPMASNYFLWIIIVISVLAVLSWALGYI
ncbi:g10530 [Coccomyxa viridis]|uniref:G10530 protein n=1 Tax=Coccomyxa viridis TaxID=1274662 RepID=A0ABP1G5H3_9CHLO